MERNRASSESSQGGRSGQTNGLVASQSLSAQLYPPHLQAYSQPQPRPPAALRPHRTDSSPYHTPSIAPGQYFHHPQQPPLGLTTHSSPFQSINHYQHNRMVADSILPHYNEPVLPPNPYLYPKQPVPDAMTTVPQILPTFVDEPQIQTPEQGPSEEEELARALALSQTEDAERQLRQDQMRQQEEEDLARALAESMLSTGNNIYSDSNPFFVGPSWETVTRPMLGSTISSRTSTSDLSLTNGQDSKQPQTGDSLDIGSLQVSGIDEASIRSDLSKRPDSDTHAFLQENSDAAASSNGSADIPSIRSTNPFEFMDDASFENSRASHALEKSPHTNGDSRHVKESPPVPASQATSNHLPPVTERSESPSELAYYNDEPSSELPIDTPAPKATQKEPSPDYRAPVHTQPNPSANSRPPASSFSSSEKRPSASSTHSQPTVAQIPIDLVSRSPVSSTHSVPATTPNNSLLPLSRISSNQSEETDDDSAPVPHAPLNPNQFIDPELLVGVSIGFTQPTLSPTLKPMEGAVPNIISMPYGKCPALHIQALSWKHILKLMARMSSTKIEPTVQAMAITKTELRLRTVIQFVRPTPSTYEWRTIIWFKIDHPVPPGLPNAHKYANPHPNVLPYPFTLMTLPLVLQNAVDSPISKTYSIPATDSLPYPTLPINFPNLALYLQAVLDFSRGQKDDSNGFRKLAKMVNTCYPNHVDETSLEQPDKSTVSDLFKRVIGRNNRKQKGKSNNETYELITPFVPDEWG